MKPILLSLGPVKLYSFGLLIALGILFALYLMTRQAKRKGFPTPEQVSDMVFVTLLSGFLGGRLFYVIQQWPLYQENPWRILALWEGGLIFYGGLFGAVIGLSLYLKRQKISWLAAMDFLAPFVALVHAFGRVGCFLNGCCHGQVCYLPWAVTFPGATDPVHPTQLYEAVFLLGLFLYLRWVYAKAKFTGQVIGHYFMFYAVGRYAIEFFRADNPYFYSLTSNQWMSVVLLTFGFMLTRILRKAEEA